LKAFQLALVLLWDILRIGPQGVFHAAPAVIDPLLDLRGRQIVRPAGFGNRRFTLNNVQHQRAFALGGPTLDVVFHLRAHRQLRKRPLSTV
jgi:hypothetical protein